ncbi:DUF397 domain-containing protein [Streptomyces sp. P9(2023)]|uniref:DUF397 domain-containing protein n=1 Tax=Streptomyces sp. P9(2023) TaxID=3064394 RepID=UPI0028F453BA|nr:DUF397 domain-containing protein [Streptomyces sp. P9(2023)]MDT9693248.1 DUF397 domain-containing protein [Streptomyces sp. P9(2023)]
MSLTWQKSSYCSEGDACVHVATAPDGHIRLTESADPTGSILTVTPDRFRALLDALKAGDTAVGITVAHGPGDAVHLRADGTVTTDARKWDAFVRGVRDGEFDHFG